MICPNCGKSHWFFRGFCPFCKSQFPAPPRPKSVTVISWLAIISSIGQAFVVLTPTGREIMAQISPLSRFLTFASITLLFISGVVMFRGTNWARWAFVVTVAYIQIGKVFSGQLITSLASILGLVLVATAYFYLFRPGANAFFSGTASQAHKPPEGPKQSSKVTSALPQPIGEPGASPNGGPTKCSGNAGAGEGPPSVS